MKNQKSIEEKKKAFLNRDNHSPKPPLAPIVQPKANVENITEQAYNKINQEKAELEEKLKRSNEFIISILQEKQMYLEENRTFRMSRLISDTGIPGSLANKQWTTPPNQARINRDQQNDQKDLDKKPSYFQRIVQKRQDLAQEELKHIKDKREIIKNYFEASLNPMHPSALYDDNKIVLLDKIGSGGFGSVWKAWDFQTSQVVAVKFIELPGTHNELLVKHMAREFDIMLNTNHQNVVKCYRYFFNNSSGNSSSNYTTVAYVMDYCERGNLYELIRDVGKLSQEEAKPILVQIIQGLQGLKSKSHQNVIHYDLKPANVVFDSNFVPKLCDFGLSKTIDQGKSIAQSLPGSGTPGYTAPEAFVQNMKINLSADVWSLGIIYYEMLTGNFETRKSLYQTSPTYQPNAIRIGFTEMCNECKLDIKQYENAIQFINDCTIYSPKDRIKITEIFQHSYLREYAHSLKP